MKELVPVGGHTNAYGIITAPTHKGIPHGIKAGKPFGIDPGCLDGPNFVKRANFEALVGYLKNLEPYRDQCLFLAVPDVVGNAIETMNAYEEFAPYFTNWQCQDGQTFDWPLAYVVQNGSENLSIPSDCTAIFIGGIPMLDRPLQNGKFMDWKDSSESVTVIKRAQAKGLHIHIGRVNWYRRFKIFQILAGSEHFTFDGTRVRYEGTEKTITAWQNYQKQKTLFNI